MACTSPPYYGLRAYLPPDHPDRDREIGQEAQPDCLAWARGGEPCGGCYVCALRAVFAGVWRVLRDDGTLWLNLGDSYSGSWGNYGTREGKQRERTSEHWQRPGYEDAGYSSRPVTSTVDIPEKNLLGIPWRVALALQADGWILRADIVWAKPNCMPESVQDRPTRAHEYLFLFAKSKRYYYDAAAIAETAQEQRNYPTWEQRKADGEPMRRGDPRESGHVTKWEGLGGNGTTRNRRTVWSIPTAPYAGAHYAVMPEALVEPCVLAGSLSMDAYEPDDVIRTPIGSGERENDPSLVTGRAGMNRPRRDVEGVRPMSRAEQRAYAEQLRASLHRDEMAAESGSAFEHYTRTDISGARPIPPALLDDWIARGLLTPVNIPPRLAAPSRSVVLDPFAGSGTVARVALRYQRRAIGIELSADYIEQHIEQRTNGVQIDLFAGAA